MSHRVGINHVAYYRIGLPSTEWHTQLNYTERGLLK